MTIDQVIARAEARYWMRNEHTFAEMAAAWAEDGWSDDEIAEAIAWHRNWARDQWPAWEAQARRVLAAMPLEATGDPRWALHDTTPTLLQ